MTSSYKLGTTNPPTALDSLGLPDPQPAPADYAEYVILGNGDPHGVGYVIAEWRWKNLSVSEMAILQAYIGNVYITTPDIEGVFATYSARMSWPQSPEPNVGDYFQDFAVRFIKLIAVPGTS